MPKIHRAPSPAAPPSSSSAVSAPAAARKPASPQAAAPDAFIHTQAEADKPDAYGAFPSLQQMFARSMPVGHFKTDLGSGQLATERIGDTLRVYLKAEGGFSYADNAAFRAEAARRFDPVATTGMSEALFDDPRTSVRFVLGPTPWKDGAPTRAVDVRPSNRDFAFASIPVSELKGIAQGGDLSLYAEVTAPDWKGGTVHAFLNPNGQSFSNFQIPAGLLK